MSVLAKLIPEAKSLSRVDKLRLIQLLAEDLAHEDSGIAANQSYAVWSPDHAFAAAELCFGLWRMRAIRERLRPAVSVRRARPRSRLGESRTDDAAYLEADCEPCRIRPARYRGSDKRFAIRYWCATGIDLGSGGNFGSAQTAPQ